MKIRMEFSDKQLLTIRKALDLYSRVLCGQIEETIRVIERTDFSRNYTKEQRNQASAGADLIKQAMFSEIYPATYGISSEERLPQRAAIGYDVFQVIEKFTVEHILKAEQTTFDVFKTAKENLPTIELC